MQMRPMKASHTLNEAYQYDKPVPFSRGTRVDIKGMTMLFISGTASVDEHGQSVHRGDLEAQARRMFKNVTELLKSEGATWRNVARTTIYLKHMDEHYHDLARIRMEFFKEQGITEYPASTCIQATLCRPELLVEMEAIAILETGE
jgi:enamine deaminase RidA (YjgF/YER057c/UK114 family)